jgi:hypothetical protein
VLGLNSGDRRMERKSVEEWGWGNTCPGVLAEEGNLDSLITRVYET